MKHVLLLSITIAVASGCSNSANPVTDGSVAAPVAIRVARVTSATFRGAANDAALWRDASTPENSVLLVTGGEGGLELHDLSGARLARLEGIEADFVDVRQSTGLDGALGDIVIASDQRLGTVRLYAFDATTRTLSDVSVQPLAIHDAITGLCTYQSPLTGKLYAYVATDQGQLEQWELFANGARVGGILIRRIPAGMGAGHCVSDDATSAIYFSEETVGVWRIAAEPEADTSRVAVDLIKPFGGIEAEVKGVAMYRIDAQHAYLLARDAGANVFRAYPASEGTPHVFEIGDDRSPIGDAEGLTVVNQPLGPDFPHGMLIVADENSGDYKLVALEAIATGLGFDSPAASTAPAPQLARTVKPVVETTPVASYGDAADDPAIWVDPRNPERSVVVGTDKKLGLNVYDLNGKLLQSLPDGRMNNVDLRSDFPLGKRRIVLVAATNRTTKSLSLYELDPSTRRLSNIAAGTLDSGLSDPYGLCMYRSARSNAYYVLANDSVDGKLRQWKLIAQGDRVGIEKVREIAVGSQAEGCVADDELGHLYVAEEDVGLWKYPAEPDAGDVRISLDDVETGHLTADVEGVSIYYGKDGTGFLVVSNQGKDNYALYRREGANPYLGQVHVVAQEVLGIDGASETDGLDVVSAPLGAKFPAGLLVVQDGRNLMPVEQQNFKFVSFQDVLATLQK